MESHLLGFVGLSLFLSNGGNNLRCTLVVLAVDWVKVFSLIGPENVRYRCTCRGWFGDDKQNVGSTRLEEADFSNSNHKHTTRYSRVHANIAKAHSPIQY